MTDQPTVPEPVSSGPFPCPTCGKPSRWMDNPFRPFCRDRCKLVDLGAWASEDYRVPLSQGPDFDSENPDDY